jgi:hypothetical protein
MSQIGSVAGDAILLNRVTGTFFSSSFGR